MNVFLWIVIGIIVAYLMLLNISACLVNPKKEYCKDSSYYRWLLMSATWGLVHLFRINIDVTGDDLIPDGRFLLISNHRSNFDPILTWHVLKKHSLAYISKEGNFHIPAFGRIIRRCCFLSINRNDPAKARITVEKAAKLMSDDVVSVGVYPEGKRSKNCVLLPFHASMFRIAQKANVPVVVMAIEGTEKIHSNIPFHKSEVKISILKIFTKEEVCSARSIDLSEQSRSIIEKQLDKNEHKYQ